MWGGGGGGNGTLFSCPMTVVEGTEIKAAGSVGGINDW